MVSTEEIEEQFDELGIKVTGAVLDKCLDVCVAHDIDAEELVNQWMAYSLSKLGGAEPSVDLLCQMERKVLGKKEIITTTKPVQHHANPSSLVVYNSPTVEDVDDLNQEDILSSYSTTPKTKSRYGGGGPGSRRQAGIGIKPKPLFSPASFSPTVATPSQRYSTRTNAGSSLVLLDGRQSVTGWQPRDGSTLQAAVRLFPGAPAVPSNARYMFEDLRDKGLMLDEMTDILGKGLVRKYSLPEPENPNSIHPEPFVTYGRVCCDSDGHLNPFSVLLEGSRELSGGTSIPLDLVAAPEFSLFPGQVVAVQGTNVSGTRVMVQRLFTSNPAPPPSTRPFLMADDGPLQLVVAAGPYTTSDNMTYQPLEDLMVYVKKHKPHVLILVGPFIDVEHPHVVQGTLAETFHAFIEKIVNGIMVSLKGLSTQVVLVSSSQDAHHQMVYPTPPFVLKKNHPNLQLFPDPCLIDINGLVLGVTSVDVMLHIGRQEISHSSAERQDRLGRLASHVLSQQVFYPLYPPDESLSIDTEMLEEYGCLEVTPHVLILPSDLRSFVKKINDCVVINPEHLAKGMVGGSFVRLEVNPPDLNYSTADICAEVVKV